MELHHQPDYSVNEIEYLILGQTLIDILVYLIVIVLQFSQIVLLSRVLAGQHSFTDEIATNHDRMQVSEIIQRLAQIATAMCFLVWIYRAHRNLPALSAHNLTYSPGWAVGGFFIPVLNLVHPYLVIKEIWKASSSEADISDGVSWQDTKTSPLLGVWWSAWVVANILGQTVLWLSSSEKNVSAFINITWLAITSYVIGIIAAALILFLVREIDARQKEKISHLMGLSLAPENLK